MNGQCNDCERDFDEPDFYRERHGLSEPPYESFAVCPYCGSDDISFDEVF